jgi:glycosyltransferase involved in cell wall biosynthesis
MYPESGVAVPYKAGEYLASGLPLINSLNGEMLRLIKEYDCGLNYKAGNPDSLLFVMRTLLKAEIDSLESMKKNALRLYSDKFDRNKINSSLTRFIEQL